MKKLLLATAALALTAGMAAADTIRMGTEGAYAPYNFINDAGEVEVRNERGQVQQASTNRMRQAAAASVPGAAPAVAAAGSPAAPVAPAAPAAPAAPTAPTPAPRSRSVGRWTSTR